MSWVTVGVTVGSAVIGQQNARAQRKAQERQNMAAAAQTEYSPWTKMGRGEIKVGGPTETAAALQGGLTGFQQGQNITDAMNAPSNKPSVPESQPMNDFSYQSDTFGNIGGQALEQPGTYSMFSDSDPMKKKTLYQK